MALVRLRTLTEAECYARCYGDGDDNVRFVKLEPRRPRLFDTACPARIFGSRSSRGSTEREPAVSTLAEPSRRGDHGREPAAGAS